jgi:hypothetical protein
MQNYKEKSLKSPFHQPLDTLLCILCNTGQNQKKPYDASITKEHKGNMTSTPSPQNN